MNPILKFDILFLGIVLSIALAIVIILINKMRL